MNKKTKYAHLGAIAVAATACLKNVADQLNNRKPGEKFNWWQLAGHTCAGGAIGGVGGFVIGAICDYNNRLEAPRNTDAFLAALAGRTILHKEDPLYIALDNKAQRLIGSLKERFKNEIKGMPYKYGSTETGCALKDGADIDLCMECHAGSFASTEVMYFSVEEFLKSQVGNYGIVRVRAQRVSIGVYFLIGNEERKIDVTPKKLTKASAKDTSGYLFLNKKGVFETPGRTKTDVRLLKSINLTDTQKRLLVILKNLKIKKDMPISSSLLQFFILYTYEAYRGQIPAPLTKKVILVLKYMADNICHISIQSPENTNNILTNGITDSDKNRIRNICLQIIGDYQYQPNSIIDLFGE